MTVAPPDPIAEALAAVLDRHRNDRSGELASYIPELAAVDPEPLAASLVSVHGILHHAGDATTEFTIQSVSKAFVYALAACDHGVDVVARHVGFEPSGEPFNAISLDEVTGRPANPLINAGAIVTTALVAGDSVEARFERIRRFLSACAARELFVDEDVFASEAETGDRNRALAYLARANGVLEQRVEEATEAYFRQCSVVVTTDDLAMMAATLANGGVNPHTRERVMPERVATVTLSIMATCGMYDHSGEWMATVGLPAKSGVGGGIAAASTAHFGIGVFSPRLDGWGNSVRGSSVLRSLSTDFDLHVFDHPDEPRSPIVRWGTGDDGHLRVVLRGELDLISTEEVTHRLVDEFRDGVGGPSRIVLDVTGVTRIRPAASRLLIAIRSQLRDRDVTVVVEGTLDEAAPSAPVTRS